MDCALPVDSTVSGFLDCDQPIQVPNPVIRHCLGLYPLASFLAKGKNKDIVQMQGEPEVEAFLGHVFPVYKGNDFQEQISGALTYLQHYQPRMLSTDPLECRDAAVKVDIQLRTFFAQNANNV